MEASSSPILGLKVVVYIHSIRVGLRSFLTYKVFFAARVFYVYFENAFVIRGSH